MNKQAGNAFVGFLLLAGLIWGITALFSGDEGNYEPTSSASVSDYNSTYNSYDDYSEQTYPVGFEGTDYMEACNSDSGNCYDLEIDSDGENVERINFPNGGWRDVDYSDCDSGYCVVEDEDGTEWELQY